MGTCSILQNCELIARAPTQNMCTQEPSTQFSALVLGLNLVLVHRIMPEFLCGYLVKKSMFTGYKEV